MSHLSDMMEKVRQLKSGASLQNLLDEAYKIMGNPIVLFNTEYKLIAYTQVTTDDPIWNDIALNGTFGKETEELIEGEGFIEEIANAPKSVLLKSPKLKYDRILGKILNKNNSYVSNLLIVACNKPFEESDLMVFEAVCKLVSREISKNEFYQKYEQSHQETVITNLINGNFDRKINLAQVGTVYNTLESSLYVVVVDTSLCDPEHADIARFRDLLMDAEPVFKYAIYANDIVIIISTNDDTLNVSKKLVRLIHLFEQNNMYAGISGKFENLFELQIYYAQALETMQFAMATRSSQRIFPCIESSREKMKQIQKLKAEEGIQYLLDIGPDIFGNPLLFHDMELNLLAYSKNMEIIDPIWEELITYGTSSDETISLFKTEGFVGTMENTKGGAFLISDKIKYDRISWRIYSIDNIMIGCLSIVNTNKPFTEDELVLFGAFSQKFSKEVGKIAFYNNYGQVYSGTVIDRLLSGKIDNYTFYSEDIGNLYDNLMDNLYLLAVDTSHCDSEHANITYIRELFNRPHTVNRYAIYANNIVIIISMDNAPLDIKIEFDQIEALFEQNSIYAGVSSCFSNIYELQKYYKEAVAALNDGLQNRARHGNKRIFLYDNTQTADA